MAMRSSNRLLIVAALFSMHCQLALGASCSSKTIDDIRIVLDVGHIAKQKGSGRCQRFVRCPSGQTSARGVPEYDFNIRLAQRVKEKLVGDGFRSTYMMLSQVDGALGLKQRADRANSRNADIFISIHHDGVRDEFLEPWLYQGEEHFFFDGSNGFSLHVSVRNRESLTLAQTLADQLIRYGLAFNTIHERANNAGANVPFLDRTRGIYRRDELVVLNRTQMPAVLLEAGVIVNRNEELALSTPARQAAISAAIADAIRNFCGQPHPGSRPARGPGLRAREQNTSVR